MKWNTTSTQNQLTYIIQTTDSTFHSHAGTALTTNPMPKHRPAHLSHLSINLIPPSPPSSHLPPSSLLGIISTRLPCLLPPPPPPSLPEIISTRLPSLHHGSSGVFEDATRLALGATGLLRKAGVAATYMHAKLESPPATALHCTALHCTALHCTALPTIILVAHAVTADDTSPLQGAASTGAIPATHRFRKQTGCKVPIVHTSDNNVQKMTTIIIQVY